MSTSKRLTDGRFIKGSSGNPTGRPKTENSMLRSQLAEKGPAIVKIVTDAALAGDLQACKLILDRISPPLKPQTAPVSVALPEGGSITDVAQSIIHSAANGELAPDIAAQLVGSIGTLARVMEINELKNRIDSLERAINAKDAV